MSVPDGVADVVVDDRCVGDTFGCRIAVDLIGTFGEEHQGLCIARDYAQRLSGVLGVQHSRCSTCCAWISLSASCSNGAPVAVCATSASDQLFGVGRHCGAVRAGECEDVDTARRSLSGNLSVADEP